MLFLTKRVKHQFLETCVHIRSGSWRLRNPEGEVLDFGRGETSVAGPWETPSIATLNEVALRNLDQFQGYAYAGFCNNLNFRIMNRLVGANSLRVLRAIGHGK